MNTKDFQILLYVDKDAYEDCVSFYGQVLGLESFYGWDEGVDDRGIKFHAGGAQIVVLTQEDPFPEYGPVHMQIEVEDLQAVYEAVKENPLMKVTQEPFVRPYGWKMFRCADPAGNHINIYQI